jgi:hypothetical protein
MARSSYSPTQNVAGVKSLPSSGLRQKCSMCKRNTEGVAAAQKNTLIPAAIDGHQFEGEELANYYNDQLADNEA